MQQKKRLEAIQEAWKAFEDKKEVFVNFLAKAEERVQSVFKVLSTTKDLAVMNAEFGAYQVRVCVCIMHMCECMWNFEQNEDSLRTT